MCYLERLCDWCQEKETPGEEAPGWGLVRHTFLSCTQNRQVTQLTRLISVTVQESRKRLGRKLLATDWLQTKVGQEEGPEHDTGQEAGYDTFLRRTQGRQAIRQG